jgi:hypothetical protein
MKMKKKYTEELKKEIARMYDEGLPIQQIAEAFDIDRTQVSKFAHEMGCEKRLDRKSKKTKEKVCPTCKHKNPSGSNFCNHCGQDIRCQEEIMLKKLEGVRDCISYITNPDARTKADTLTIEIIRYFEGKVN